MFGLSKSELAVLRKLNTPHKIQDFLNSLPINFEEGGDTYMSPRRVLREGKAHCFEGALLAATALWLKGEKPLLLDLKTGRGDCDHVVALYRQGGRWGAISKTNHAVLRFRDPIYHSVRELAASYFHEYFLNVNGRKTLKSYSQAFNLARQGQVWITAEEDLWHLAADLDDSPHFLFVPPANKKFIRPADSVERKAGEIVEWVKPNRRV